MQFQPPYHGAANGGLGASIQGDFLVTPGETLSVLVGGAGATNNTSGSGGGVGSFVWRGNGFGALNSNTLLIAAGGGGSFNGGENQNNNPGVNPGNGEVEITFTPDTQPLIIDCPDDITVANDPGQCSAEVTYEVTAEDLECGVASITCDGMIHVFDPPQSPVMIMETRTFPVGTTTVTCTAQDAAGNSSQCMFDVTVEDTEPPIIDCPADITVFNDPGRNGAFVNFPEPTVSDNCQA